MTGPDRGAGQGSGGAARRRSGTAAGRGRLTQARRTARTRAALVRAGRRLFAERGFAGASARQVAAAAGVSPGALYHHFAGKRELFAAVFEDVEAGLAATVAAAGAAGGDPWRRLRLGVGAYMAACDEPEVRTVVLIEGPRVLGLREWRERDAAHHLLALRAGLAAAMRAGLLEPRPPEPLARVLMGALTEAGLSPPEDRVATAEAALWVLERMRSAVPASSRRPGGQPVLTED